MTTSSFEKMLNIVIHDMMNGHRLFNMYQNRINFGYKVEYYVINMFLRFKDDYALWEGYHGVI